MPAYISNLTHYFPSQSPYCFKKYIRIKVNGKNKKKINIPERYKTGIPWTIFPLTRPRKKKNKRKSGDKLYNFPFEPMNLLQDTFFCRTSLAYLASKIQSFMKTECITETSELK